MASRKEEKERLRRERLAAERREASQARRRLLLGYVVAGALGAIVLAGIVVAILSGGGGGGQDAEVNEAAGIDPNTGFIVPEDIEPDEREGTAPPAVEQADLEKAVAAANCKLQTDLPEEGNGHLTPSADPPDYETEPPTSGDHSAENLADGAYLDYPAPVNFVHSMEHGRVEIHYDPALAETDQLALKGLFDSDPQGMLMFPNPEMPYEVAATAWINMLVCKSYDPAAIDAIRNFRDTFRGQGPEAIPF